MRFTDAINTADLRSYVLQNLVGTYCCPTFVHAACLPPLPLTTLVCTARMPSTSSSCVLMHCRTLLLPTAVLHSYAALVCRQRCRPVFVHVTEPRCYPLLSYIHTLIRKKRFALERRVGLSALETLGRTVAHNFSLERAQRISRNPYVEVVSVCDIRQGINSPCRVSVRTSHLTRCILSTQRIGSNMISHEMTNVQIDYPFGCHI